MKFWEYMGHAGPSFKGSIGLEIETECSITYAVDTSLDKYWEAKADGSLRQHGVEYVFRQPLNYRSAAYKAAMELFKHQADKTPFIKSPYSSVHVHFNMLTKETVHMMNFICLYFLFEELLTLYCGNERYANLFCLNTSRAEQVYKTVKELAIAIEDGSGRANVNALNNGLLKYSGLNIVPLRNFGSVEVRTHPGTANVAEIDRWVGMLHMLYERADTYLSPVEIVSRFQGYKSKAAFVELIFQEYTKYLDLSNLDEKMHDSLWYVTSIAAAVNNWKDFGNKLPTKRNTSKYKMAAVYDDVQLATWTTPGATIPPNTILTTQQINDFLNISPTTDL